MTIVPVDFRPHVIVFTKDGRTYDLGPGAIGERLGDVFGESCPERMRDWKRYRIAGGKSIIAQPDDQPIETLPPTRIF